MTESIDRQARNKFVENDEGYKLVREGHNKMHAEARNAKLGPGRPKKNAA